MRIGSSSNCVCAGMSALSPSRASNQLFPAGEPGERGAAGDDKAAGGALQKLHGAWDARP